MILKKIAFTGLLLSSVFLVACRPQETDTDTETMMLEETPAIDEDNIIMEGTDQPMPGEEEMYLENNETMNEETASPTASPLMESDTEVETETTL